ncbi:MAG TPA: hypothetical protein VKS60_04195 [Stellaceae bacterium]|nr:hypothetical protein [Stellaceae bacterium]
MRSFSFDTDLTHSDEGFYLLQGAAWLNGAPPYTAIWDVKPPGLVGLFALFGLAGPPGVLTARIGTYIAVVLAAVGLHRFARRHLDGEATAWVASLLFPAYSIVLEGTATQPELLLTPIVVFAMDIVAGWWTGRGDRSIRSCLLAGLLLGVAASIKQSTVCDLALAAIVAVGSLRQPRLIAPAMAVLAAGMPFLAFIGYEAALGLGPEIYLTPVTGAVSRLGGYGTSLLGAVARMPFMMRSAMPLLAGPLACLVERRRLARGPDARAIGFVFLWLLAEIAAVIALRATYWHYLLTALAPMALLTAVWMRIVVARLDRHRKSVLAGLVAVFVIYPAGFLVFADIPIMRHASFGLAVADRLRSLGMAKGDTLYVADRDPVIYLLTGATLPTRYVFPQHLLCSFPLPEDGDAEIRRIMAGRPRFVVISAGRPKMVVCDWRTDRVALIDDALARNYRLAGTVDTGEEPAEIYRRIAD